MADAGDPYAIATRQTLEHGGYAVDTLEPATLRHRYPHLEAGDASMALLEPDCGVLMARRAVRTLAAELVSGGKVRLNRAATTRCAGRRSSRRRRGDFARSAWPAAAR